MASLNRRLISTCHVKCNSINLILCAVEYDILSTADLNKMAVEWGQMKNRRVKVNCDK